MSHPPSGYGVWFYCDCTPPTISLQFLLCLWMWGICFGEFQCLLVDDYSVISCDSGALTRGSELTSFYSAILNQSWVEMSGFLYITVIFWYSDYLVFLLQKILYRDSLAVLWFGLHASTLGGMESLVREVRSHMLCSQETNEQTKISYVSSPPLPLWNSLSELSERLCPRFKSTVLFTK